jgi:hypothetical protein
VISGFRREIDKIVPIRALFSSNMKLFKITDWNPIEKPKNDHRIDG